MKTMKATVFHGANASVSKKLNDKLQPVSRGNSNDRATFTAIARRAMIERGLEPDFPAAAQQELAAIRGPATPTNGVHDLRDRLWCSIDNDDSRGALNYDLFRLGVRLAF